MGKELNLAQLIIRTIIVLIFSLTIAACEEKIYWTLQESEPFIVVDALITNEFKEQEVKIYWSNSKMNELPKPISGAELFIWDGTTIHEFNENITEPGVYNSTAFAATIDVFYYLIINYNGFTDTAMASANPLGIQPFKKDTVILIDSLFKYVYTGSYDPAMTEIYYDWSNNVDYCNYYGNCYASETFYSLNIIDVGQEFAPNKQEILFPSGTTITRRKYSLSSHHEDFIRSLLIETEWRGGLFDMEQGNVPTNFNNGTRGWFGVCMVLEETKIIE